MAKNYRACADKARKETMHTLNKTLSTQETAELKGVMWVFKKRWQALTMAEQIILLTLFRHAPALKDVYIFREALSSIFNSSLTKSTLSSGDVMDKQPKSLIPTHKARCRRAAAVWLCLTLYLVPTPQPKIRINGRN